MGEEVYTYQVLRNSGPAELQNDIQPSVSTGRMSLTSHAVHLDAAKQLSDLGIVNVARDTYSLQDYINTVDVCCRLRIGRCLLSFLTCTSDDATWGHCVSTSSRERYYDYQNILLTALEDSEEKIGRENTTAYLYTLKIRRSTWMAWHPLMLQSCSRPPLLPSACSLLFIVSF